MKEIAASGEMVSKCGLYCGACRAFLKGKCKGCAENARAAWCKIRTCCIEKQIGSCAECGEFDDPVKCGRFNNLIGRIVGFLLNSDRAAGIRMIGEKGRAGFARHMAALGRVAIKRRGQG